MVERKTMAGGGRVRCEQKRDAKQGSQSVVLVGAPVSGARSDSELPSAGFVVPRITRSTHPFSTWRVESMQPRANVTTRACIAHSATRPPPGRGYDTTRRVVLEPRLRGCEAKDFGKNLQPSLEVRGTARLCGVLHGH